MKKILGLTMLTMLIVCCEVGPRQASASSSSLIDDPSSRGIQLTSYEMGGMEYRVFSMYKGGMCIVNLTKDKLEVELLKKQINEDK